MRNSGLSFLGTLSLSGILAATLLPSAQAAPPTGKKTAPKPARSTSIREAGIEKLLLDIRILQNYRSVLNRYGQPNRIYKLNESFEFLYAVNAQGDRTGGILGLGDATTTASGGQPAGGMGMLGGGGKGGGMGRPAGMGGAGSGGGGGMMGMGRPPGMGGAGSGGGGMMTGMMRPPGMGGGMGSGGGGLPGFGGQRRGGGDDEIGGGGGKGGGGMLGGAGGGMGGGANGSGEETFGEAGGFVWAYVNPISETAKLFAFNKDGRLEVIFYGGRKADPSLALRTQSTSQGITLGSPVQNVYSTYGWPDSNELNDPGITLYYNDKHHVQFDLIKNKVVAITVVLRESVRFNMGRSKGSNGGGGGGMAGMGAMGAGMGRPAGMGGGMGSGGGMMRPPGGGGAIGI